MSKNHEPAPPAGLAMMRRRFPTRRRLQTPASTFTALALTACLASCANGERDGASAQEAPETPAAQEAQSTAAANLAKTLPAGWRLSADGKILSWDAPAPLPVRDAFIQVHIDDRLTLVPAVAADRKSVSVVLPTGVQTLANVRVTAAGVSLDGKKRSGTVARSAPGVFAEGAQQSADSVAAQAATNLPAADDPGLPGQFRTTEAEYEEPSVKIAGLRTPVEIRAVVVAPVGAPGARPVAVFLHGNHSTCYQPPGGPERELQERRWWPCPAGMLPVPSYRGYLDAQRLLASQGVITISISQNGINAQTDQGFDIDATTRAALLREHLTRWSRGAAGFTGAGANLVRGLTPDLKKLLLVGHSRGGAGINRFTLDSMTDASLPWKVRGQLLIGPTNARRNPAPGVPNVVLLPACDGDVANLEGQFYADDARDITADTALRSVVYVEGANHNFFNAQWTPGVGPDATDDWDTLAEYAPEAATDTACAKTAPTRLTAPVQRTVGAVYAAAAAQLFLYDRTSIAPLLDGSLVRPLSIGPVVVRTHALGGYRKPLAVPTATTTPTATTGATVRLCKTSAPYYDPETCVAGDFALPPRTPSFGGSQLIFDPLLPSRSAVHVQWTARGGRVSVPVSSAALDTQATAIAARVIVPPTGASTSFRGYLVDRAGKRVALGSAVSLSGVPTSAGAVSASYWAQEVRLPLDRAAATSAGVNLTQLASLELEGDTSAGQLWLLDAWSYRTGLPAAAATSVARVDVPTLTVTETDAPQTTRLRVPIAGRLNEPGVVFYSTIDFGTGAMTSKLVSLSAGQTSFNIDLAIAGDDEERGRSFIQVQLAGVKGVVAGNATNYVTVEDDELSPSFTFAPTATASEGSSLVWTFTLPRPSARVLSVNVEAVAPTAGRELSFNDIASEEPSTVTRTLSDGRWVKSAFLLPGETSLSLEIPLFADGVSEGSENVALELTSRPVGLGFPPDLPFAPIPGIPEGTRITGTVTDAP